MRRHIGRRSSVKGQDPRALLKMCRNILRNRGAVAGNELARAQPGFLRQQVKSIRGSTTAISCI
jgi:hypothetical protein